MKSITHKSGMRALKKLREVDVPASAIESVERALMPPPEPTSGFIAHDLHGPEMAEQRKWTRESLRHGKPKVHEAIQRSNLTLKEIGKRAGVGKETMRRALYGGRLNLRSARAIAAVFGEGLSESEVRAVEEELRQPPQSNSKKSLHGCLNSRVGGNTLVEALHSNLKKRRESMLRFFAKRLRDAETDESGFTLIELLVVIIIIGILAAIAIPTFLAQRERAWEATAASDVRNAAAAATSCSADNGGSYLAPNDCSVLANLQANGFNPSALVTINGTNASATGWTTSMQHNNGGSAFTFTTANGRVTEAARGAAAPAAP